LKKNNMSQKIKWSIDPTHTEIGFKVRHMMFTNVSGKFGKYQSTIETESDDFTNAMVEFTADIDSLSTGNTERDQHLLSPDFFDAARFPTLDFTAASFEKLDDGDFKLAGDLTMHGVTKPISLAVEFSGLLKDPWGNSKVAFTVTGKIHRKDWGLVWNAALESGGVLVSDDVSIHAEIQLIKQ
jgi:polyisoprenoid-binding protein YceI